MKQTQKTILFWVVIFLMMALLAKVYNQDNKQTQRITYSAFVEYLEKGDVKKVIFKGDNLILGEFNEESAKDGDLKNFELVGETGSSTFDLVRENGITPDYEEEEKPEFIQTLLLSWAPMIFIVFIFLYFLKQLQGGGGKAMSFGKSKARMLTPNDKKVTFSDVAGVDEAKEELKEVVDFLKYPKKYTQLGGKIPKGVILVGPPGTGKTLIARAVAGEAGVPFFSISGSDFVEMFVGVGASRVRDLFEQGKKHSPCIIFIDEIDAVGRHRGSGMGGGHDEREQTLNQLLVEMDGFESNEGVILIAATNRIDVLDPALLRPGRFDRRVMVGVPDVRGRLGILKVHAAKTPLDSEVDLEIIAKGTPGFSGADLANLVNEAALNAARTEKTQVTMIDFEAAKDKVLMGPERKSQVISDAEKLNTAYHEAGHTLVGMNLPHTDPIHKVSIIPRGGALGVTQTLPNEDRLSLSTERAHNFIAFLMGGRCAEELVFNEYTNGAANDIERATSLAYNMICNWGMSKKLGPVKLIKNSNPMVAQEGYEISDKTSQEIDDEIFNMVDMNYKHAMRILEENRESLDKIADALIVWETITRQQIEDIVAGKDIGVPLITPEVKKEEPKSNDNDDVASTEAEKTMEPNTPVEEA